MKITSFTVWVGGGAVAFALLLGYHLLGVARLADQRTACQANRARSLELAHELLQSSEDLTRMARTYVCTGDPRYESRYWEILAIRNGRRPRPTAYPPTFWYVSVPEGDAPHRAGTEVPLQALMRQAGFTEAEFQLLHRAQARSDALVEMEREAFKAMKGTPEDQRSALQRLHGEAYHHAKTGIMQPIQEFMAEVDQRTHRELDDLGGHQRRKIQASLAFLGSALLGLLWVAMATRRRIVKPLEQLGRQAEALGRGDLGCRSDVHSSNELEVFSRSLNQMADEVAKSRDVLEALVAARTEALRSANEDLGRKIQEHREVEARLRASEATFHRIFHAAPMLMSLRDPEDGCYLDVNEQFCRVSGFDRDEVLGKTPETLGWMHPQDGPDLLERLNRTGSLRNLEVHCHTKSGGRIFCLASADLVPFGDRTLVVSMATDITGLKRVEEARRLEAARLEEAFRGSPIGMAFVGMDGRFLKVNGTFCAMLGRDEATLLALRVPDITHPEDVASSLQVMRTQAEGGLGPLRLEKRYLRADGSWFWAEAHVSMVRDESARPLHYLAQVQDLTERLRAEQARAEAEAREHQIRKAESLGTMAGAVAHHVNNQLQSVLSSLEMLERQPRGADLSRYLGIAQMATALAAEVGRKMLTYVGQRMVCYRPLDLGEACRNALTSLAQEHPEGLIPGVVWPQGLVVKSDPGEIRQVLANLIANAWEATGESGAPLEVRLVSRSASDLPIIHRFPVGWEPQSEAYAGLEVQDQGHGIPETDLERLFDPFFSTKFPGRGLGLPEVLGIAQAHGGAVVVESWEGKGSCFRVYLPLWDGNLGAEP